MYRVRHHKERDMKKLMLFALFILPFATLQAQKEPTPTAPQPSATSTPLAEDESADFAAILLDAPQSRLEDGGFVVGDPDAPITFVEFSDWACPHCQVYREVIEPILAEYLPLGLVRYEFRPFPTAGGETTIFASQVAECTDELVEGGFWQSYFVLYDAALEGEYSVGGIIDTVSDKLDIDQDELLDCVADAEQILADYDLAVDLGVRGTPALLVRYGDGDPEFIVLDDVTYNLGGPPEEVLRTVIEEAADEIQPTPTSGK
jgi:protein-disulfide isomerase